MNTSPSTPEANTAHLANSVFFDQATIDGWIAEDAPLLDLTTHLLAVGGQHARMRWLIRSAGVAACTEEAARVVQTCGATVEHLMPSGSQTAAGEVLLEASGPAAGLLRGWKIAQNLLEYACGVASATARMVHAVRQTAPNVAVLTTRKHAPGLRRLALKATLSGGAFPHRLGVGETVLVFPQHRALLAEKRGEQNGDNADNGGWPQLARQLAVVAPALAEKTCVIEAHSLHEALQAVQAGADVVQFDKATPEALRQWCPALRAQHPHLHILAAGGIRLDNAADFAASGVDALVTSSLHYAAPADVGVQVEPD